MNETGEREEKGGERYLREDACLVGDEAEVIVL